MRFTALTGGVAFRTSSNKKTMRFRSGFQCGFTRDLHDIEGFIINKHTPLRSFIHVDSAPNFSKQPILHIAKISSENHAATIHSIYPVTSHVAGKNSSSIEISQCRLHSALNLAQFGCLKLYGSSNWEGTPYGNGSAAYLAVCPSGLC